MPVFLLLVVTTIYLWVAILFAWRGDVGMAIIYFGYAFANVGLVGVGMR